jgi:hypothetical protein
MKSLFLMLAGGFWVLAAVGCGSGPVKHQVTGVVELDGEPVLEGDMTFLPKDKNLPPEGARILGGKYTVAITGGVYSVKINAPKKVALLPGETSAYGDKEKTINAIPAHYNDENKLVADVKGPGQIDYKLTTKKNGP